jgi:hypothetical protein
LLAIRKIGVEQKVPAFLIEENSNQRYTKNELMRVVEKIKTLYLMLALLDARKQNLLRAAECLRIVRERVNS